MKKYLCLFLCLLLVVSLSACGKSGPEAADEEAKPVGQSAETASETPAEVAAPIKIGLILPLAEDDSESIPHIEGLSRAAESAGISGEEIQICCNIEETAACTQCAEQMISDGCTVIFAASYYYEDYFLPFASEHPETEFFVMLGMTARSSGLSNLHDYYLKFHEGYYALGAVCAQLAPGAVSAGFTVPYEYPEDISAYTAFLLGLRSVSPDAHLTVFPTNSRFSEEIEADAVTTLIASGCTVIGQYRHNEGLTRARSNAVTGDTGIVYASVSSGEENDCDAVLTVNWSPLYLQMLTAVKEGETASDYSCGYAEGAFSVKAEADHTVELQLAANEIRVFDTSAFTVKGKKVQSYHSPFLSDTELVSDGYFHEGEILSAPLFDIAIDGIQVLQIDGN